jgi:hypothetical protein
MSKLPSILWKCSKFAKDFLSKAKVYNHTKLRIKSKKNINNNKGKDNLESLINKKSEKISCYTVNSFDLKSMNYFPLIYRKKRKINTINLLKNNIKNKLELNEMIFGNKNDKKSPAKNSLIYKGQFRDSSYNNEKKSLNLKSSSIIDKSDYDQTNSKLLLTELIYSNKSVKPQISNNNYDLSNKLTINNYFSFKSSKNELYSRKRKIINIKRNFKKSKSYFNSTNINYPNNLISNKLIYF